MDGNKVRMKWLCMKNYHLKYIIYMIMFAEYSCSNNLDSVNLDGQLVVNVNSSRDNFNELVISRNNPLRVEVIEILGRGTDVLDKWPKTNIWVEVLSEDMIPAQKMTGRLLLDSGASLFSDKQDRSFKLMLVDIENENLIIRKENNPFFGFFVGRDKSYKIRVIFEGHNEQSLCVFKASSLPIAIRVN